MAIGLKNVNLHKAKPSASTKNSEAPDAWSARGLAREGRSTRRERNVVSGDVNGLWMEWTTCVAGTETSTRILRTVRKILDLEMFIFEFLVYDLQIPERAKKRIFAIRSHSARALQIRKLLTQH